MAPGAGPGCLARGRVVRGPWGPGWGALAVGANFLLDKSIVNRLFTGATRMEDFMEVLDKRHMAAHSVGPGTYSKTPKDFKQVFELFDLVRHISQAAGLREPAAVSNFQERLKISASIGYRSTDFSGPTVTLDGLWTCFQSFHELLPQYMDQMLLPTLIKLYNEAMRAMLSVQLGRPMVVLARGRVVRGPWGWRPLWQRPLFHL